MSKSILYVEDIIIIFLKKKNKKLGNNYPMTKGSNRTVGCIEDEMGGTCCTHNR